MAQQTDAEAEDSVALSYDSDDSVEPETRAYRARNERMVVVPREDNHEVCIGLYDVVTTGGSYVVDGVDGVCDCPDMEYNRPDDGCKHVRRVAYMLERTSLPGEGEDSAGYNDALNQLHESLSSEIARLRDRLGETEELLATFERRFYE